MVANYTTVAVRLPGNLAFCVLCPQCRNRDTVTVLAVIVCHFIFKYLWLFSGRILLEQRGGKHR